MFVRKKNIKIFIVSLICFLIFLLIFFKVLYIETISYNKLYKLSDDLWSRNLTISSERGKIFDRNGIVLADNITSSSLVLVPNQIKDKNKTINILSKILKVDNDIIKKFVYKKASSVKVHPYGRNLNSKVTDKINSYKLPGVYLLKENKRYYPKGSFLSNVIGYTGIDNQGLSGIELLYDKYLTGEDGYIKFYSDAKGKRLNIPEGYKKPKRGLDVMLTIDSRIQSSIERELNNAILKLNPDHALAVAMNPNTGEILAMSSRPNFNPNNYKKYNNEVLNRNLPIWMTYEPGSTFKIITTASSVEEGTVDLYKDTFYDSGSVRIGGAKIKCWKAGGHGAETMMEVFQNSCNPGFVKMGKDLGKDKLFHYINLFGFGEKTGIDLSGEGKGIIFPLNKVGDLELATTSFGQGVSVTPIQQVDAVSSVVNGGYLYKPYIMKSILDNNTNSIYLENKKILKRKTISKRTSAIMREALENVVSKGGGKLTYIDGYRVGGKTGTAQKQKDGKYLDNNYIMSFIAVLPSNKPEVVLYFAIDNPKKTALLSSYTTTPYVRRILLDIINIKNIKKNYNQVEKDYEWNDKKYYKVPNVIGMKKEDAQKRLSIYSITYKGQGDYIIDQSPKSGERYYESGTIVLLLGNK